MKPTVFLDMDMVLVNFNASDKIPETEKHIYNHPEIYKQGFFINLPPMEGAIDFVKYLLDDYDVQILTQPVAGNPYSYGEKAAWIMKYLPELTGKINMTQDKLLFSGPDRALIDDNLKWSGFGERFIHFNIYNNPKEEFEIIRLCLLAYFGK